MASDDYPRSPLRDEVSLLRGVGRRALVGDYLDAQGDAVTTDCYARPGYDVVNL
jgi:hypothetical protein